MYLATPMPERAMDREWARIPRQARQRAVATALARMQTATSSALVDGGFDRDSIHLSRTRLNISESAWAELSKRYLEWLEFIEALQQEAAESEEGMVDATAILMLFEAQATGPEASIQHPDAALPAEPKLKTQSMNLCEEVHGMLANPVTDWAGVVGHADELAALGKAGMAAQERKQS
jgi:DNA-binding PucR family transcriptional regulator